MMIEIVVILDIFSFLKNCVVAVARKLLVQDPRASGPKAFKTTTILAQPPSGPHCPLRKDWTHSSDPSSNTFLAGLKSMRWV